MFTKIDKKILIISIIAFVAILLIGFLVYRNLSFGGAKVESNNSSSQVEIETKGTNNKGTITVCVDECGNGVCQKVNPYCADNLNCVCEETPQECPQDCK